MFSNTESQLLSDNLILDGDETIVGLMSKHFLELKEIPYFFYGQSYGFSFIEVMTIRVFYSIFGVSEIAIKLAMLSLWTTGIVFFYKTLKAIGFKNNPWIPLLITLVFIFSPSFAVWSMKARGGYLTAFALTSIITFLLFNKKQKSNVFASLTIGFLIILIYQSQALWLAGLIPLVAFTIYKNKDIRYGIMMLLGLTAGILFFYFLKMGLPTFWSPKILDWPLLTLKNYNSILDKMYVHFTGNYYYGEFKEAMLITKFLSIGMMFAILFSIAAGVYFLIKKKEISTVFYVTLLSVLCSIGYLLFIRGLGYRYFLPLTGFALLMIAFVINQLKHQKTMNLLLLIWVSLGTISLYDFKNYSFENKKALVSLVDELDKQNISHIYCGGGLLQWQIMFYSKEKTIARYKSNIDRYPEYIKAVDSTFKNDNKRTALVGYYNEGLNLSSPDFTGIKNTYFILSPVTVNTLEERGFDLTAPASRD